MFEKGKWYYNKTYKYKIKYLKESDTKAIVYTDIVSEKGEYKHYPFGITGVGHTDNKNWVLIEDLSEIQKYLPDNHPDKIKVTQENYQIIKLNSQEELEACEKYFDNLGYKRTPTSRRKISEGTFFTIYNNTKEYQNLTGDCLYPKITLRDLGINVINTQEEFKVGDFFYYIEPSDLYQVTKINSKTIHIKGFGKKVRHIIDNHYNKDIFYGGYNASVNWKKAKLEEIPVKDLSNKEILEIAKQYYPIGTKFKSACPPNHNEVISKGCFLIDNDKIWNGNSMSNAIGWIYYKDKWAEIISTSQEVKDDFVLPEKWFIKVTKENKQDCNKWREFDALITEGKYMHIYYSPYSKKGVSLDTIARGYTEITTEQFKKYVLGEKIENNSVFPTELINKRIEELENSNEIYIPTITKQKKKIDYTINSVFADIKVNLPEKPKKIVKPIVLEKFNLII